jgi:uncharacterized protein DUF2637
MYHFTSTQVRNLQRGTRSVLLFGIVTSISANVLHSLVRPEAVREPGWRLLSAAALAALAPLVLFACTELVSRIPVQSRVLGTVRLVVTLAVGGFAAWVSYWHMQSVAFLLGETEGAQYVYPLIIDGMMLVATISLIELGRLARAIAKAEEAARPPVVDPEVTARRKAAAVKGAQTRRRNQATKRARTRSRVSDLEQLVADAAAPVSPAPAGHPR